MERLNTLVHLLHEQGLIPTDLYLLSDLRARRAQIEREIRVWVDINNYGLDVEVPKPLTEELATLDTQIRKLESMCRVQ
jgi:hypothetical protein